MKKREELEEALLEMQKKLDMKFNQILDLLKLGQAT